MHDQAFGAHGGSELDCGPCIGDAVLMCLPIAPRKTAGPLQARHLEAVVDQQLDAFLFAEVRQLLPPHGQRLNSRCDVMFDIFFESPAVGREFVDGKPMHPTGSPRVDQVTTTC